jgi:protein transport protein SEC20
MLDADFSNVVKNRSQRKEEITQSLERTRLLLAQEVERSTNSVRLIAETSQGIKQTHDEYQIGMRTGLNQGRQILTKLFQRDLTDRVLIFLALMVFLSVVCFILKERLWG